MRIYVKKGIFHLKTLVLRACYGRGDTGDSVCGDAIDVMVREW